MINDAFDDRQACTAKDRLRGRLMHRQSRSENTRMGVGDVEHLQHPLDRAVLAADPVQGVKDHVRARIKCPQQFWDVAPDIDHPHLVAPIRKRFGTLVPARQ